MKRTRQIISVILLLAVFLAACGNTPAANNAQNDASAANNQPENTVEEANQPVEEEVEEPTEEPVEEPVEEPDTSLVIVDGNGTEVTLETPAKAIVSMAPSITEILFSIGAGEQVVGREDYANYPEEAVALPSIGSTYDELNLEAILDLQPDLVMVTPLTSAENIQAMEEVGLTVFMLANPITLDEMYDSLRTVAQLTAHEEETETLIVSLQERVAAVETVIAEAETTPTVFYELDSTDPTAPWTSGGDTFMDTLITMAGGQNVGATFEGDWVQISSEELLAQDPAIIVLGDSIWGITADDVAARAGWEGISAVENGLIYPFDDDLASRPGPRLVDGLEQLAQIIHPELFD